MNNVEQVKVYEYKEETKIQMDEIVYKLKAIFASPITEERCNIIVDSIISDFFTVDDDMGELEALIWHVNMFLEELAYSFLRGRADE